MPFAVQCVSVVHVSSSIEKSPGTTHVLAGPPTGLERALQGSVWPPPIHSLHTKDTTPALECLHAVLPTLHVQHLNGNIHMAHGAIYRGSRGPGCTKGPEKGVQRHGGARMCQRGPGRPVRVGM